MLTVLTVLGILFATAALLAGLFAIGAVRQSSYLSRQEEDEEFNRSADEARHARYGDGGWAGTADGEGDR